MIVSLCSFSSPLGSMAYHSIESSRSVALIGIGNESPAFKCNNFHKDNSDLVFFDINLEKKIIKI